MTGVATAAALPKGSADPAMPAAGRLPRPVRTILLLGGLITGFWLLGTLLGSPHAAAAPHRPTTPTLTQQLQRTTAPLVGTMQRTTLDVQRTVTSTTTRLGTAVRSAPEVITKVTATVTTTVKRHVHEMAQAAPSVPRLDPTATHRRAGPTVHHRTQLVAHLAVARSAIPGPATTVGRDRTAAAAPVHVNRPVAPFAPARPVLPTPPAPQPDPGSPTAPSTIAGPDLSAVLPSVERPATPTECGPAPCAPRATGGPVQDPSFSPD
jgi:hypothetical protein